METYNDFTDTELLCEVNNVIKQYESTKKEIINNTAIIDELSKIINEKINVISDLENQYVKIIEELDNRKLLT
jgi:hypothetical protein